MHYLILERQKLAYNVNCFFTAQFINRIKQCRTIQIKKPILNTRSEHNTHSMSQLKQWSSIQVINLYSKMQIYIDSSIQYYLHQASRAKIQRSYSHLRPLNNIPTRLFTSMPILHHIALIDPNPRIQDSLTSLLPCNLHTPQDCVALHCNVIGNNGECEVTSSEQVKHE